MDMYGLVIGSIFSTILIFAEGKGEYERIVVGLVDFDGMMI